MERKKYTTGAPWEEIVGYSRAVQVGNVLEISGTVATDGNAVVGAGDPYVQTKFVISKMEKVLEQAGFTLAHVVRTRIYVTDITRWEEVGRAHGEFFRDIKPATAMVQVAALIAPEYLVEIEMTAMK